MKTNFYAALALLVVMILGGAAASRVTDNLSNRYISAAEELLVMTQDQHWERAEATLAAYRADWEETSSWLRTIVVHEDIDAVAMALKRIDAGIRAKDQSLCYEGCGELREFAEHISDRAGLTLGNVM